MIQVRVLTGDYCLGNKGLKSAPYKPQSATEQYDCVVDDLQNPQKYCVFHDDSAYPEYIIRYNIDRESCRNHQELHKCAQTVRYQRCQNAQNLHCMHVCIVQI